MEITKEEIYSSAKIVNPNDNDSLSHFTHFILAHQSKLNKCRFEYSDDYYEDTDYILAIYNRGVKAWSEHFLEDKIGLADVVESEWFWNECINKEI